MPRAILSAFRGPIRAWDSLQVELRGHYSVGRLHDLLQYMERDNWLRIAALLVATPIPCLLTIVGIDALPLRDPSLGLYHQGFTYWARCFLSSLIVTSTIITEFRHASPTLRLPTIRFLAVTLYVAIAATLTMLLLGLFVGFPMPFTFQAVSPFWMTQLSVGLWILWKQALRFNVSVRKDLLQFLWYFASQVAMIAIYPVLSYVFSVLSGNNQVVLTMATPLLKLALRNWAFHGLQRVGDLASIYITFSVDVFHALFLSSAMQASTSIGSFVAAITVDFLQGVVAFNEVAIVMARIDRLAHRIYSIEHPAETRSAHSHDPLRGACATLVAHPQLMDYIASSDSTGGPRRRCALASLIMRKPTVQTIRVGSATRKGDEPPTKRPLSHVDRMRVKSVQLTRRVLYMVEFYVLVEFTELVIALVYAVYLTAMSRLPNRAYYLQLQNMTNDRLSTTVGTVAKYATSELISFLALSAALQRVAPVSTFKLLAFKLSKQWRLVQALLVLWVFFVVQMSLEHYGNDYSFQFKWLVGV